MNFIKRDDRGLEGYPILLWRWNTAWRKTALHFFVIIHPTCKLEELIIFIRACEQTVCAIQTLEKKQQ